MKHLVIVFIVLLFAPGCRKDKLNNAIEGTWELRESSGGWTEIKSYEPGNGNLVIFGEQNQFTKKVVNADTSYTLLYKYSLVKEDECGVNLILQSKDNNDKYRQRAIVFYDTLSIFDGCIADGSSFVFVRQ